MPYSACSCACAWPTVPTPSRSATSPSTVPASSKTAEQRENEDHQGPRPPSRTRYPPPSTSLSSRSLKPDWRAATPGPGTSGSIDRPASRLRRHQLPKSLCVTTSRRHRPRGCAHRGRPPDPGAPALRYRKACVSRTTLGRCARKTCARRRWIPPCSPRPSPSPPRRARSPQRRCSSRRSATGGASCRPASGVCTPAATWRASRVGRTSPEAAACRVAGGMRLSASRRRARHAPPTATMTRTPTARFGSGASRGGGFGRS